VYHARIRYGFMQDPDVPRTLMQAREMGAALDPEDTTYFLGRETIIVTRREGGPSGARKLFMLMARNAVRAHGLLPPTT